MERRCAPSVGAGSPKADHAPKAGTPEWPKYRSIKEVPRQDQPQKPSCQGEPGMGRAGPATYPGPSTRTWSWNGGGGPQAWKLGSPGLERGHQPEEFDHARRPLPGWARPRASCQGEPGVVKEVPHLRGRQRGTDAGTKVEGPARGSWDHRAQKNGNQPDHAPRTTPEWARARRRFLNRGLWLHARVIPAAFASGKTGHISGAMDVNLEWTRISDDRRPQAWKRGSPEPERGNQPEQPNHAPRLTPQWARSGGGCPTGACGFTPGSSRHRSQAGRPATSPGPWTRTWNGLG